MRARSPKGNKARGRGADDGRVVRRVGVGEAKGKGAQGAERETDRERERERERERVWC